GEILSAALQPEEDRGSRDGAAGAGALTLPRRSTPPGRRARFSAPSAEIMTEIRRRALASAREIWREAITSELQHHLDHVVLVAVGVRPVTGDGVPGEAQVAQGADGIGLGVGDQHAGEMAQAVGPGGVDELVDQYRSQAGAAIGGIEEPLDAAHQAQG